MYQTPMIGLPGGYRICLTNPEGQVLLESDVRRFTRLINPSHANFSDSFVNELARVIRNDQEVARGQAGRR